MAHERKKERARERSGTRSPRSRRHSRAERDAMLEMRRPFEGPGPRRNLDPDEKKVEQAREELDSVSGH